MALIPTIFYIYLFTTHSAHINDESLVFGLLLPLTIYVCGCSFILLLVTSACLCLHFGKWHVVLWLGPLGARFDKLHKKTQRKIEKLLWAFLLTSTLTGLTLGGFFGLGALAFRILGF